MNLKATFPILDWLPNYKKENLQGDISAGLTVGIMLIPQGMAYAMLAGLPPIYGLYASIVPQLIYAIFGTSRQLGVGPVAMDSLLVAVTVSQFAQAESSEYIAIAILLALLVGLIQVLMYMMRLGFLVNFLSHPVISGFTSAAALIIGFSQLKYLMGVELARSQYLHEILWNAAMKLGEINPYTLFIGMAGILIIIAINQLKTKIPSPLVVVIFGTIVVYFGGLATSGVDIVAKVPSGLPPFSIPTLDWEMIQKLLPSALTISVVAFMEAISVAKAIQQRHNDYQIHPNQELLALGLGNVAGAFFKSFPGTGGFSRSAVNDQAGAKTNLAAIISASFVALTLLFLTPYFYYLPKAVLASIIMVAVFKLISVNDAKKLWKTGHKADFWILIATFIATLSIGIQKGILVGVLLSIAKMLYTTMQPAVEINDENHSLPPNSIIFTFKEQLYFANANFFKEKIEEIITNNHNLQHLIVDGSAISRIDSTGEKTLRQIETDCIEKGIEMNLLSMPQDSSLPSCNSLEEIINKKSFNNQIKENTAM